jgi:hypothetical protein
MHMKRKLGIVLFLIAVIVGAAWVSRRPVSQPVAPKIPAVPSASQSGQSAVTVIFDDGKSVSTFSGVTADTAFKALLAVVAEKQLDIETKKYDFGVFVSKVADKESGKNLAWIYFINGKSGTVAADEAVLQSGDTVEWRYMKPTF